MKSRLFLSAVALFGACSAPGKGERYETAVIERGNLSSRVTATGTLSALVTVQVGSQVSGRIQELKVDFNSRVKKGELLARLDPQLFAAALESARANRTSALGALKKAQVQAEDAERQAVRARTLLEQRLVSQAEADSARAASQAAAAQVLVAQGALEQAQAALSQAQINLSNTSIHSPIDGIVISRNVEPGQTVAASLQAPTLFVLAEDLARMQVDTSVSEADVGKLKEGMEASFRVDAWPNARFTGKLRQVRSAPQTVQNVVTYNAVLDVDNGELRLKPGMTANVTFITAEREGVLRIPNAALRFRPSDAARAEGMGTARNGARKPQGAAAGAAGNDEKGARAGADARTVHVLKDGKPSPVRVTVGITDGSYSELIEGAVEEGVRVITDAAAPKPSGGSASPFGGGSGGGTRRMF